MLSDARIRKERKERDRQSRRPHLLRWLFPTVTSSKCFHPEGVSTGQISSGYVGYVSCACRAIPQHAMDCAMDCGMDGWMNSSGQITRAVITR